MNITRRKFMFLSSVIPFGSGITSFLVNNFERKTFLQELQLEDSYIELANAVFIRGLSDNEIRGVKRAQNAEFLKALSEDGRKGKAILKSLITSDMMHNRFIIVENSLFSFTELATALMLSKT